MKLQNYALGKWQEGDGDGRRDAKEDRKEMERTSRETKEEEARGC